MLVIYVNCILTMKNQLHVEVDKKETKLEEREWLKRR